MTPKANNGTELLVEKFSAMEAATQPKWLLPVRKAGLASFADQGFPTLHDEDWRFTNVAPIAQLNFHLAQPVSVNRLSPVSRELGKSGGFTLAPGAPATVRHVFPDLGSGS